MFGWFKRKPEILCIHGNTPFLRHMKAAVLFQDKMHKLKSGTIVCTPKAVVSILNSLGIDTPDEMRWWNSDKKWEKATELIKAIPGVRLSETPVNDKLVWVDSEELADGMHPAPVTLFTGTMKEDPFLQYERTTYSVGKTGATESWPCHKGQYCSSWARGR